MKSKKVSVSARKRRLIVTMAMALGIVLTSCNVVRTITTQSEAYSTDEKQVVITTKTIEQYTANKQ